MFDPAQLTQVWHNCRVKWHFHNQRIKLPKQGTKPMNNTYTIAIRNVMPHGPAYSPAVGIPCNLTLIQAEKLAKQARFKGVDCVAFNVASV